MNRPTTSQQDLEFMRLAIEQAKKCTSAPTAFNVGAVIVCDGSVITTGYSRELPGNTHAEECALDKLKDVDVDLSRCIMYTTMEPCSERLSGKRPCHSRIIESGIRTVALGVKEPDDYVQCTGVSTLRDAQVHVYKVDGFEDEALSIARTKS